NYNGEHLVATALERLDAASAGRARAAARLTGWLQVTAPYSLRRLVPPAVGRAARVRSTRARRFWVVPTDLPATAVRINVIGRELRGTVRPGPEFGAVCDELRRDLLGWRDPVTNQRLVREVVLTHEAHPGPA